MIKNQSSFPWVFYYKKSHTKLIKGVDFEKLESEKKIEGVKPVVAELSITEKKLNSEKETKFYI